METVELGTTGMAITRIGFGAWAVGGGGYKFGWGEQADEDSVGAIDSALDAGINWIDTAAVYGLGRSEAVVGEALRGRVRRPYVFTKASRIVDANGEIVGNLTRDSIRREVEASLQRLGVDAIDLYQIHQPFPDEDIEVGWQALVGLRDEGVVRHIGVSNFSVDQLRRAESIAPIETLQPPYSLLAREIEDDVLPFCLERRIGVIAYSPMASGLLSGTMTRERIAALPVDDWRSRGERFREPQLSRNLELAARLGRIGARSGVAAGAVAVAWAFRHPAVNGVIVGFRNSDQVKPILRAADLELGARDIAEIENEGATS
jgi:aryl-alcohol dehydrogenase-like predicted oxidoreductase